MVEQESGRARRFPVVSGKTCPWRSVDPQCQVYRMVMRLASQLFLP